MTEDQNDQTDPTADQPTTSSVPETTPTPGPETTGQAIALPATTPPAPADLPQQPDTPPMGVPQGAGPRGRH